MPELMSTGHPLHLRTHILIDKNKEIVQKDLTKSFLLFGIDEFHAIPEHVGDLKGIPGSESFYKFLGYLKDSLIHLQFPVRYSPEESSFR